MSPERRAMIDYARTLLGAKWRHRGRKPWAVDCLGIVVLSYQAAGGGDVDDHLTYGREPWREGLREAVRAHLGEPIPLEEVQPGDVGLFAWPNKEPSHIAIFADYEHGGLSVIHSLTRKNVSEHRFDDTWKRLFVEAYRTWPT